METVSNEEQLPSLVIEADRWNELQDVLSRVAEDPKLYKHADIIEQCQREFQPQTYAELALAMFYAGRGTYSLKGTNDDHELVS